MKRIAIISILALMGLGSLKAQLKDKLAPHFGYMYTVVNIESLDPSEQGQLDFAYNTLGIGAYFMLAHKNDFVSVGVDPNLNVGLRISSEGRVNWIAQLPVFLMGRIGAKSTHYNTQKIGLAAGIGAIGTYLNYSEAAGLLEMKEMVFNPAAVFEGSLMTGNSYLTARVQFSIAKSKGEADLFTPQGALLPNRQANFGTFGIGLIYGF